MNLTLIAGLLIAVFVVAWSVLEVGSTAALFNLHGFLIVFGGTVSTALMSTPLRQLSSAMRQAFALFFPQHLPTASEAVTEIVRLARMAHAGGGLLSLQGQGRDFVDGFLHRAITVAIATGESGQLRKIMERQIRLIRIGRQEDTNVFRTISVLSPMFGILGTLLGMIQVLGALSDPTKVGPAMALALSSAFLGISVSNFVCVPIAGALRLRAMRETLVLEIALEGMLDIQSGKAPYLVELHLASYSEERRGEMEAGESGHAAKPAAAVGPGAG
ncbi:MAG: MotA/TolQ/ExbB proton channel family protein [Elusimicrobiota bacterium]